MPSAARRVPSARAKQSVAGVQALFNPGAVQQQKVATAQQQVGALQQRFAAPAANPSMAMRLGQNVLHPNRAMAGLGQRMNLGGSTGRIAALQEGYERSLAFQQPGMRGLLAAGSAAFGGDVDDDTRLLSTLRQAGLGVQQPR